MGLRGPFGPIQEGSEALFGPTMGGAEALLGLTMGARRLFRAYPISIFGPIRGALLGYSIQGVWRPFWVYPGGLESLFGPIQGVRRHFWGYPGGLGGAFGTIQGAQRSWTYIDGGAQRPL